MADLGHGHGEVETVSAQAFDLGLHRAGAVGAVQELSDAAAEGLGARKRQLAPLGPQAAGSELNRCLCATSTGVLENAPT